MGCNTSQELKTSEGVDAAAAAAINGEIEGAGNVSTTLAGEIKENGDDGNSAINHHKSNSITTNGDTCNKKSNGLCASAKSNSSAAVDANAKSIKQQEQLHHSKDGKEKTLHNGVHNSNETKQYHVEHSNLNISDGQKFTYAGDNEDIEEEKAATKIQAVFRGHQVRSTMKKSENNSSTTANNGKSAATEQNGASAADLPPTKAELEAEFDPNDKELCEAASKIQATFRGHLQRKIQNKEAPDDEDIQEITKKVAEELDIDLTDPELNKAATKIQASFRGHKTRKDTGAE